MPSPFPGMDPYLEHPGSWPDFHHRLITAIAISLGLQLLPKYQVLIIKVTVPITEEVRQRNTKRSVKKFSIVLPI